MTAVTYEHNVDFLTRLLSEIISFANGFIGLIIKLPWIVALIPLLFFGLIYTFIMYILIFPFRFLLTYLVTKTILDISVFDKREAMIFHSRVEGLRIKYQESLKTPANLYIFQPVNIEIEKIAIQLHRLEVVLFKYVYPDYEKPLSIEEEKKLIEVFKNWKEDWTDEKLNILN